MGGKKKKSATTKSSNLQAANQPLSGLSLSALSLSSNSNTESESTTFSSNTSNSKSLSIGATVSLPFVLCTTITANNQILISKTDFKQTNFNVNELVAIRGLPNTCHSSSLLSNICAYGAIWPSDKVDCATLGVSSLSLLNWDIKDGTRCSLAKIELPRFSIEKLVISSDHPLEQAFIAYVKTYINTDVKHLIPHITTVINCNYLGSTVKLYIDRVDLESTTDTLSEYIAEITNHTIIQLKPFKKRNKDAISYKSVGGLEKELAIIREMIELPLTNPEKFEQFGLRPPRGLLLYGPPGTGKTHLAKAIAAETDAHVIICNGADILGKNYGESEERLRQVFQEAADHSPSIIFIDEIDALCPKRDESTSQTQTRLVATLLTLMDGSNSATKKFVVIAATNRPDALDSALRRPGRFDREVEIGVPTSSARNSILQALLTHIHHNLNDLEILSISQITHGYVGADLSAVCREAGIIAIKRTVGEKSLDILLTSLEIDDAAQDLCISHKDMLDAVKKIKPSAMREIMLQVPQVSWDDICGHEDIKQRIREAVEWPLLNPQAFARFNIKPPKGILLYGPPGCSKTLMAKAIASSANLNFIAVKGPELFSKYVGESEKAVRKVFQKARAASPSVIFFDEIDAIGLARGSKGSEVNDRVLAQLLAELDGIVALSNVVILAATNRPDVMDPALLRPGRIDRMLYVGPPDYDSRCKIIMKRSEKMSVSGPGDFDVHEISRLSDGFSGAETVSICQEAAYLAMEEDLHAQCVSQRHFVNAVSNIQPQITHEMIEFFDLFRKRSGLISI